MSWDVPAHPMPTGMWQRGRPGSAVLLSLVIPHPHVVVSLQRVLFAND